MTETKSKSGYHLLGRSGLRVSPLALGTMTFGTEWGWGSPAAAANEMLAIDADTIACGWDGSRVDYGRIVGHLVVADGLS